MGHDWLRCQDMTGYDKFKTFFKRAVPQKGNGGLALYTSLVTGTHCDRLDLAGALNGSKWYLEAKRLTEIDNNG